MKQSELINDGPKRTERIAEAIRRELTTIIQNELSDPRLPKWITLSAVTVSKDLRHAKVYFTVLDGDPLQTQKVLNSYEYFIRPLLGNGVRLRIIPNLNFVYDKSIEYAKHINKLIDKSNPDS